MRPTFEDRQKGGAQLRVVAGSDAAVSKRVPHNLEAEQALLGAIFTDNAVLTVIPFLEPEHFFDPLHQSIFRTASKLIRAGSPANAITLKTFFGDDDFDATTKVWQYLATLTANATTTFNAVHYARTIVSLSERRLGVLIGEDIIASACNPSVDEPFSGPVALAKLRLDDLSSRQLDAKSEDDGLEFADATRAAETAPYLIKGLITCGSTNAVYGPSRAGKTFLALDIAFHVARGKPYGGRRVNQAPVLYIGLEGHAGLRGRIDAQVSQHGSGAMFARLTLPITLGTDPANVVHEQTIIRKAAAVEAKFGAPVGLIIVDTYAAAVAGDNENEAATVAAFMARCERIKAATGAAILFAAHPGKNADLGMRGSSALLPALDTVIRIDREEDAALRSVTLEKVKDGVEGPIGTFTLKRVELGTDGDGDPITSCVVEYGDTGVAAKLRKMPKPNSPADLCLEEINQLIIAGHGQHVDHERVPPGAVCVDLEQWRAACYLKNICKSDSQDARRQAFFRAFGLLREMNLVASHDTIVWKTRCDGGVTDRKMVSTDGFCG